MLFREIQGENKTLWKHGEVLCTTRSQLVLCIKCYVEQYSKLNTLKHALTYVTMHTLLKLKHNKVFQQTPGR